MNIQRTIFILVLASMLLVTQQGIAFGDGPQQSTSRSEAPMVLQCGQLTGKALAYANKHDLCPSKRSMSGEVQPFGEAVGDCGISWLEIEAIGGGWARFHMGANSSQGPIAKVDYSTTWLNWDTNGSGGFAGTDWVWGNPWTQARDQNTQAGFVTGTLSGVVTLWWGGTCAILNPSDDQMIY